VNYITEYIFEEVNPGLNPDSPEVIVEKRTRAKLKTILFYKVHPLHCIFSGV